MSWGIDNQEKLVGNLEKRISKIDDELKRNGFDNDLEFEKHELEIELHAEKAELKNMKYKNQNYW